MAVIPSVLGSRVKHIESRIWEVALAERISLGMRDLKSANPIGPCRGRRRPE